jgi:hypothetical protein
MSLANCVSLCARWRRICLGGCWFALVSTPEKTSWLPQAERDHILAGRDAGIAPPSLGGVGFLSTSDYLCRATRDYAIWHDFIAAWPRSH